MVNKNVIDEELKEYRAKIRKIKPLTQDEEIELAKKIEQGDEKAKDKLIEANLRQVVDITTYKYKYVVQNFCTDFTLMDLIQEGNAGLCEAVDHFDWRRGKPFGALASSYINGAVKKALNNKFGIRVPQDRVQDIQKVQNVKNELIVELGRTPTNEEIAASLNKKIAEQGTEENKEKKKTFTPDKIEKLLVEADIYGTESLNRNVGEEGESELGDFIENKRFPSTENVVIRRWLSSTSKEMKMEMLETRERKVLDLFFVQSLDQYQIAERLQLPPVVIQEIKNEALEKLRKRIL